MRIEVDRDRCEGHAMCEAVAPDGPVLARIFLDRGKVTDAFIDAVVTQWHNELQRAGALKATRKSSSRTAH